MKRLMVTGLDGFDGRHVKRAVENSCNDRFKLVEPRGAIKLTESATLNQAIQDTRPDRVLHLAAQSFIPASMNDPRATFEVNFIGTQNLLQALKSCGFRGRMLYVGSAEVYGALRDKDLPIVESCLLRPRTPA